MWIWIIIIAAVIGAILGLSSSESGEKSRAATTSGAITGAIIAIGCLARITIAALSILFILWLFGQLFG